MQEKKNAKMTRKKRCLHYTVHFTAGLRIRIQLFTLVRNQDNADIDQQPCCITINTGTQWIHCLFDPGTQTHIFESSMTIFWVKSSIILYKLAQIFFFTSSKRKFFSILWLFVATKKGWTTNFFHPSLSLLFLDPGWTRITGT
jgi:hypothetical protein